MKKVSVDQSFWDVFPDANVHILVIKDIKNKTENKSAYEELIKEAQIRAKNFLGADIFTDNEVISEWREAFKLFKTKKGARSSIEALMKRVNQGHTLATISPLVDIYNSISLSYAVPCGGEDLEAIVGNLHLGKAHGGESFLPLGSEKDSPALENEIIYYDNEGAVCRSFNWREAKRTMLNDQTTDAILIIESINDKQHIRAKDAMDELQRLTKIFLGTSGNKWLLTKDNSSILI